MKFDFENINLIPKKALVESRSQCDTSLNFGGFKFEMPIVPANMEAVINIDIAIKLASAGYFYTMHRFDINQLGFIRQMKELQLYSSISIGVNEDSYQLIEEMIIQDLIPHFITIDIAHGHCIKMEKMLKFVKEKLPHTFIIAGNVSTAEAVEELQSWGADAIKVGVGPGGACTTYPTTGFGSRNCQASTIWECSKVARVPIVADGGIKVPGDIAKSLTLGATMVMVGSMLAGQLDSPGKVVTKDNKPYKKFWGSASAHQSGKNNRIEGKVSLIELKDKTVLQEINYLKECLQSAISYAGGDSLKAFESTKWH
jgi:GMP reductase